MVVRNHRSYQPYHTAVEKTSLDHWRYFAAQAFDFGLGNSGWRNFSNEHSSVSLFLFSTFVSALAVLTAGMVCSKRKECSTYEHEKQAGPEESATEDATEAGAKEAGAESQHAFRRPEA
jgi:hypothetical protein